MGCYFLDREELERGDCVVRHWDPRGGPGWRWFREPSKILQTRSQDEVKELVGEVEAEAKVGRTCVGFLSYEASEAFDPVLPEPKGAVLPLLWFAVFDEPAEFVRELLPDYDSLEPLDVAPGWDFHQYAERFRAVKDALKSGDAYQINLTFRMEAHFPSSLFRLFRRACGVEPPPYATYLRGEDWEIACLSPELFLERTAESVRMSPMKGTRASHEDRLPEMTTDPKSLAENLMIVDMVRNDLGRVARVGSVSAPSLFRVEAHRTVNQMTSSVEASTDASLADLLGATFPPASVTGAPKIAACRMISSLESSAREVYCGAIGVVEPGADARFAVGIRTAWRAADGPVRYGIGSGIVWDSEANEEFEECLLKADVLVHAAPQWELIECFHRSALGDDSLLEKHWERVSRSARALGVPLCRQAFEAVLEPLRSQSHPLAPKIRVAIRKDGAMTVSNTASLVNKARLTASFAPNAIPSAGLGHKTNSRQIFQQALDMNPGYDEVLLFNERGEAAEFCWGNAVFVFGARWITPWPECGGLAGIGARLLVNRGQAEYGIVRIEEARNCDAVYLVNSIRGLVPVDVDWLSSAGRLRLPAGSRSDPDTTAH